MRDQIRTATNVISDTKISTNLVLTDLTGCYVNDAFVSLSKEQGKISMPFCEKSAILGISGIKKVLLNAVNAVTAKPRVPFDTLDEAKDWLVE